MSRTTLETATVSTIPRVLLTGAGFPAKLGENIDLSAYPKLSKEQCGHLRHFHNLASQIDGDWGFMGSQDPGQEWDTAFRYQIATMAYATGAAHYHRLPAMRGLFKPLLEKQITKMLRSEVWSYWYLTSQSGVRINPDLKELRKPWADPVCKENIMYSGHLLCMVSLYTMLFQDRRFDEEGSLTFEHAPMFWGLGPETFKYSRQSLQDAILKEMEREKWMGVCCEPNMIFIICNQFPLISMKYNDATDGTDLISTVLPKYKAAWEAKGLRSPNGLLRRWFFSGQQRVVDSEELGHTAWGLAFMPWNEELQKDMYPSAGYGYLHKVDGRTNVRPPVVANAIKQLVQASGTATGEGFAAKHEDPAIVFQARELTAQQPPSKNRFLSPVFGWVCQWFSEVAPAEDLASLLRHADEYLTPTWNKGGLYYARNNGGWDAKENYIYVDPHTSNAAIGYGRLNVFGGQKNMWEHPRTKEEVDIMPIIDGVVFEDGVDCLRGVWDEEKKAMVATFRSWDATEKEIKVEVNNLSQGSYGIYIDGSLVGVEEVIKGKSKVVVPLKVGGDEVDLVVLRAQA